MKKFFCLVILLSFQQAFAYELHQYDKVKATNTPIIVDSVKQPKSTKVYDEKGYYQGEYVQKATQQNFMTAKVLIKNKL